MNDTTRPPADNTNAPVLPQDKTSAQPKDARNQASEKASNESWLDTAKHFVHHPVQDTEEGIIDFGQGALYAAVQTPVDGAVQLTNHIFDKHYTAPVLVSPSAEINHSSKAGETVGAFIDVVVLSHAVAGVAAAVGLTAGPTLGGAALVGAVTMGVTGVITGALSPVDKNDKNFWTKKSEQIAVDGAAFAAMGGVAPAATRIFGTTLIGRTIGGAVSGSAASSAQNEVELAFGDDSNIGWANVGKAALYGAAFGASSRALDSVKGSAKNMLAEHRENMVLAAFDKDPINNPPSTDNPAQGKWTSSTDDAGNTLWSRTYQRRHFVDHKDLTFLELDDGVTAEQKSVQTLSDRVLVHPNGVKDYVFEQDQSQPNDFALRTVTQPDGSFEANMPKPRQIDGETISSRQVVEHNDGTRLVFEGDKVTVKGATGKPIEVSNGTPNILTGQADAFPDQYIISQLKAVDGITDGVQADQPGKSVRPDGTKITVSEKGGAIWAVKPDGTVVITNPNGSRFVGLPDRTEIHDNGHGRIKVKYPSL